MFYTFIQNNSKGKFIGPSCVIVEADSAEEANEIAERDTPVYFGVRSDDCYCCGHRWTEQNDDDDGTKYPEIYGLSPFEYVRRYGKRSFGANTYSIVYKEYGDLDDIQRGIYDKTNFKEEL